MSPNPFILRKIVYPSATDEFINRESVLLGGGNEFINIDAVNTALASTARGAWTFFIKPVTATPSSNKRIIAFGDADAPENIEILLETNGNIRIDCRIGGTTFWEVLVLGSILSDNVWSHIIVEQDGTAAAPELFHNNTKPSQTNPISLDNSKWFGDATGLDTGRIGNFNYNNSGETGHINASFDEIHFFRTELGAVKRTELYRNGRGWDVRNHSSVNNLVAGFHIDGDIVDVCRDYVNFNDGTYVNVLQSEIKRDVNG